MQITPELFLEWATMSRAEVKPLNTAFEIELRFGHESYVVNCEDFTPEQARQFVALYRERRLRFAYPGDFTIAPMFVAMTNTRHARIVEGPALPEPFCERGPTLATIGDDAAEPTAEDEEAWRSAWPQRAGYHHKL